MLATLLCLRRLRGRIGFVASVRRVDASEEEDEWEESEEVSDPLARAQRLIARSTTAAIAFSGPLDEDEEEDDEDELELDELLRERPMTLGG
jgi:hypothetical protein